MNAPAKIDNRQVQQVAVVNDVQKMEKQFALALPEHVSPERFVRVVLTAINSNPELQKADRTSVLGAAMKCAQDGLLPDGREAALVVYGGKASYLPMIAGVLAKVRRSGELLTINAHIVYERDTFSYVLGDEERIEHQPYLEGDRGKPIAAYAVAKTKDGGIYREVMSVAQINQVRNVSRAKNNGPWVSWWDEMARKTVLRRLSKRLPMSTDLLQVFQRDDDHYDLTRQAAGTAQIRRLHADFDEPADDVPDSPEEGARAETQDAEFTDKTPEAGGDDDFPGDKPAGDDDELMAWSMETSAAVAQAESLDDLNAITDAEGAEARFAQLQEDRPAVAKALLAAIKGKRKALADKLETDQ